MKDASRFAIVFRDLDHIEAMAQRLCHPQSDDKWKWRETKNRFANPTDMGWRDLTMIIEVQLPGLAGDPTHLCEVQVQDLGYFQTRVQQHVNYEVVRSELPDIFGVEGDVALAAANAAVLAVVRDPMRYPRPAMIPRGHPITREATRA